MHIHRIIFKEVVMKSILHGSWGWDLKNARLASVSHHTTQPSIQTLNQIHQTAFNDTSLRSEKCIIGINRAVFVCT